jgi:hypothetical protein
VKKQEIRLLNILKLCYIKYENVCGYLNFGNNGAIISLVETPIWRKLAPDT